MKKRFALGTMILAGVGLYTFIEHEKISQDAEPCIGTMISNLKNVAEVTPHPYSNIKEYESYQADSAQLAKEDPDFTNRYVMTLDTTQNALIVTRGFIPKRFDYNQ